MINTTWGKQVFLLTNTGVTTGAYWPAILISTTQVERGVWNWLALPGRGGKNVGLTDKIEVTMGPDLLRLFQFLNLKIHLIQQIIQQILFLNNFVGLDLTTSWLESTGITIMLQGQVGTLKDFSHAWLILVKFYLFVELNEWLTKQDKHEWIWIYL